MTEYSRKNSKSVDFSVGESVDESQHSARQRTSKTIGRRRSSFLKQLSRSFRRSGGERGADVETLRGTHGPDFEGEAIINRGGDGGISCGCFGGGKDAKERLLLIKGPFVFVYSSESDKAPKYAINLAHLQPKAHGLSGGSYRTTLETALGDVEYEIFFKEENIAKNFVAAAKEQATVGEADEVRKRLGHESLVSKRSSIRYAEKVAMKKVEDQPEKRERLTAEEMAMVSGGPGMPM